MRNLSDYISQLRFVTHYRGDCPKCGRSNTFSVSRLGTEIKYHCFSASCDLRGAIKKDLDIRELPLEISSKASYISERALPDEFVNLHSVHMDYLEKFNALEAYLDHRIEIYYDPKKHRIVFCVKHNNKYYNFVGRSLNFQTKPKWLIYSEHNPYPLIAPGKITNEKAIIVEDAISACAVSSVCAGIALLGTSLHDSYIPDISAYDHVVIALDKDASKKSIELERVLSFYIKNVDVMLLERDLKYESKASLREMLL
jgi:hypothetical protein